METKSNFDPEVNKEKILPSTRISQPANNKKRKYMLPVVVIFVFLIIMIGLTIKYTSSNNKHEKSSSITDSKISKVNPQDTLRQDRKWGEGYIQNLPNYSPITISPEADEKPIYASFNPQKATLEDRDGKLTFTDPVYGYLFDFSSAPLSTVQDFWPNFPFIAYNISLDKEYKSVETPVITVSAPIENLSSLSLQDFSNQFLKEVKNVQYPFIFVEEAMVSNYSSLRTINNFSAIHWESTLIDHYNPQTPYYNYVSNYAVEIKGRIVHIRMFSSNKVNFNKSGLSLTNSTDKRE